MSFLLRFIPAMFFWGIFIFVVLNIPYPESFTQANSTQISLFFIPLYLALVFTLNILLKNILSSSSLSFGLILLLTFKALDYLNITTGLLITVVVVLLISYFRKAKKHSLTPPKAGLTKSSKIPKLTKLR